MSDCNAFMSRSGSLFNIDGELPVLNSPRYFLRFGLTPSSSIKTNEDTVALSNINTIVFISAAKVERFASGSSSLDNRDKIRSRGGK